VYSVPLLASRVKQPAFHIDMWSTPQREGTVWSSYHTGTKTLTTLGCGTCLVSIGSQRWRAECTEHLGVVSVLIHVRFTFGMGELGTVGCLNVSRNYCKWYRTLCEPTWTMYSGFLHSHAPKTKNKISSEGQKHIFPLGNEIIWKIIINILYCAMFI
jgi:hypothetical protein